MKLAVFDSSTSGTLTDSMCRWYLLLAGLAMILARPTSAQIDSALSLFPLKVGDTWQYHEFYTIPYPLEYVSKYHFVRVVGDSSMPNGKRYKYIEGLTILLGASFLRIDSSSACVYQYVDYPVPSEALLDSLRASPGDEIWSHPCGKRCTAVDTASVFGILTTTKSFQGGCVWELPRQTFAGGFGLIRQEENAGEGSPSPIGYVITRELVYASVNEIEHGEIVGIAPARPSIPASFSLDQNFPNPFNPTTTIKYELPSPSVVRLSVYDILGQEVSLLVNDRKDAGLHEVKFDGSRLASGAYLYRLTAGSIVQTRKLLLVR